MPVISTGLQALYIRIRFILHHSIKYMKKNMGKTDRFIRSLVAIIIFALYFNQSITGVWGNVLLAIAVIFVVTSLANVCPLYSLLGINTCAKQDKART